MSNFAKAVERCSTPTNINSKLAALGMERWFEALKASNNKYLVMQANKIIKVPALKNLLDITFSYSPYLTHSIATNPAFTCALFQNGPERLLRETIATIRSARKNYPSTTEGTDKIAALLRKAKRQASLAIAMADISGVWDLNQITDALSELAEASISTAAAHLLSLAANQGVIKIKHQGNPENGSGLIILGLGKLGSRELNYSSDVDLIILYLFINFRNRCLF